MSFALVFIILAVLGIGSAAGVVGFFLGRQRLAPPAGRPEDRRLAEQTERIELLEDELHRVKAQADFTERLLTERPETPRDDASIDASLD